MKQIKFLLSFAFKISKQPFISKLQKLMLIQTIFPKKHFQAYQQAVRKNSFNFTLTEG